MEFQSRNEYESYLKSMGDLPLGFRCHTRTISFRAKEDPHRGEYPMNLALLQLEEPTESFAAVFTKNAFVGAPVVIGRSRLSRARTSGVLINNKISNVGISGGIKDAQSILSKLGQLTAQDPEDFFVSSTGVIGWALPVNEMLEALPQLLDQEPDAGAYELSKAIMTTDAYPKLSRWDGPQGTILGVAKGAGMIEPNMATMLSFIMTDIDVPKEDLQDILNQSVSKSFNAATVDGDQSTSDMVLVFSSGKKPYPGPEVIREAMDKVCTDLAKELVRNGEGTTHVIQVEVTGAKSTAIAGGAAKAVLNSPLVKTAIYGNDPNVGRIVAALGDELGSRGLGLELEDLIITMGGVRIFEEGGFSLDAQKERQLAQYLKDQSLPELSPGYPTHHRMVEISIQLSRKGESFTAWGSDLTHGYINENADYRS